MCEDSDIRKSVDALVDSRKRLVGEARWIPTEEIGEYRMFRHISQDGTVSQAALHLKVYPNTEDRDFRILITFEQVCICRLDCAPEIDKPHLNDFGRPFGFGGVPILGFHFHGWSANRRLATKSKLPDDLKYAEEVRDKIRNINDGFRWFCEKLNFEASSVDEPDWPQPDRFL